MTTHILRQAGAADGSDQKNATLISAPPVAGNGAPPADARRPLHVVVADADADRLRHYEEGLTRLGCQLCVARTGRQLIEQCRILAPDLIIADARLPELDGVAAVAEVCRERPTPIVLASESADAESLGRALNNPYILAFLSRPVRESDLAAAVALAVHRFKQLEESRREAAGLRQILEERKLIERAKGVLMQRIRVDEAAAYRRLRKLSSNRNLKLVEIARIVLAAEETFAQLEQADAAPAPGDGRDRSRRGAGHAPGGHRVELTGASARAEPSPAPAGA